MSVQKRARRRRRLPREERREQILDAALEAFSVGGYHGTHVDDVIQQAGIARGTFYLHFPSKHDVFAALVDRMLGIFLAARPTEPDPELRTLADAETVLRRSYETVLSTFRRHRRLCLLLFEEAVGLDKGLAERLEAHHRAWHGRVRDTLAQFEAAGLARSGLDLDVTADLVVGMVERVTRRHVLPASAPDLGRLVEALVRFEIDGIRRPMR